MRKILLIIITLCLTLCLCSCQQKNDREVVGEIVDGANRKVDVYRDGKNNTVASVYFVATPFFTALKMTDRVLAVNTRNSFWLNADEGLKKAGTVGKGTVDLEKLASYNPTCLVHRSNDPETVEAVEKLGIDVICITVENAQDIIDTLSYLGKYFNEEENAEKAINWFKGKIEYIDEIVSKIPNNERKTAMLIGGEFGRVSGCDMMQTWMIEKAGGIPVVKEGENHNWINIGEEKILQYNPDVLFCTSSAARSYSIDDLYDTKAYSELTAIKNKDIYDIPTKLDSWDMPGISCELGIMYMLHKMYPNYFSKEDLEDEVDDYYRFMFGRCFDQELGLDWDHFE